MLEYQRTLRQAQRLIGLRWLTLLIGAFLLIVLMAWVPIHMNVVMLIEGLMLLMTLINALNANYLDRMPEELQADAQGELLYHRLNVLLVGQMLADFSVIVGLVHATGGAFSPVKLFLLIYLATMATVLPRRWILTGLGVLLGLVALMDTLYVRGILHPLLPSSAFALFQKLPPMTYWVGIFFFDLSAVLVVWLVHNVAWEAEQFWQRATRQERRLKQLHHATRLGLHLVELSTLYEEISVQMQAMLGSESLWLLRWDGETNLEPIKVVGRPQGKVWLPRAELLRTLEGPTLLDAGQLRAPASGPVVAIPLGRYYGQQQHMALAVFPAAHTITPEDLALGAQIADTMGLLLSRTELYQRSRQRTELMEHLVHLLTHDEHLIQPEAIYRQAVQGIRGLLKADRAAFYLYNAHTQRVECPYQEGLSEQYVSLICHYYWRVPGSKVLEGFKPVCVSDIRHDPRTAAMRPLMEDEHLGAYAVFGTELEGHLRGALVAYWDRPHTLVEEETAAGQLYARHTGMRLQNALLYQTLSEQSMTDALTGLPNRRALDHQLTHEAQRSRRSGRPFTLIMLDMDGFKTINDVFGHPLGDQVLQHLGGALQQVLRTTDFIARYGGDEFAVILPDTDLEGGLRVARKIRWAVQRCELPAPATGFPIGVSQGMAEFSRHADEASALLRLADQALYFVKQNCKGGVATTDSQGGFRLLVEG